jgi:hypothetical protein
LPLSAAAQSFSDVSQSNPAYGAIEYLKTQGILRGYPDGTFKPDQAVNRAEALKIIVAQLVELSAIESRKGKTSYGDVAADAWFAPFVEVARADLKIIDGPPKSSAFSPTRTVNKVEFLKMLLLGNKIDPTLAYGEIKLPLSSDVSNPSEWYYPHVRYAMSASMLAVNQNGTLEPAKQLTRGDISLLLYRFLMYRENRRTQALLSLAEDEILNVLRALEGGDIEQAEFASARSLLSARGALTSLPEDPLVKGAVKTSEGFRMLTVSYRAGSEGRLDDAIKAAGDAWNLAEQAKTFSSGLTDVAVQMQTIAKSMADEGRRLKAGN